MRDMGSMEVMDTEIRIIIIMGQYPSTIPLKIQANMITITKMIMEIVRYLMMRIIIMMGGKEMIMAMVKMMISTGRIIMVLNWKQIVLIAIEEYKEKMEIIIVCRLDLLLVLLLVGLF